MFTKKKKLGIGVIAFFFAINFSVYAQQDSEDMSFDELAELSLEELLNLEVTVASKKAEKISDAAGVISVITKEELEAFGVGGLTLRDLLERVPSLTASSSYFTDRYIVASRGDQTRINAGHNLILINGRPTREVVEGGISSEMYAAFPVSIIERIEVIRGPGSVLYGSNAFSTVINVITKKVEKNNVAVSGLMGDAGAYGATGDAQLKFGDVLISGAGRYMKKADWETSYTGLDLFNPGVVVTTDISIPDEALGAYLGMQYKGLNVMASHNAYNSSSFIGTVDPIEWKKSFINAGYGLKASDKWNIDLNVTYNYATLYGGLGFIDRKSNDLVAEWTNHLDLTKNLRLIVGGLYNNIKGKETSDLGVGEGPQVISDESRGNFALYSQLDYWVLESLKLIGGFQANKVENTDIDVVPRGGVIWYPVPRINIKALYSQAFRAASVDEIGLQFPGFTGNPNIRPENVATVDVGVNYLGERIQGGVNYFRNKQSDIIAPGFVDTLYMYVNKGTIEFQGVEVEGKYYISRDLFLTGSLLYQENEDEAGNENVTPIANFGAKGGISYRWSKGITASLFNIYQGKLDEAYTNTVLNPRPGSYNILNLYASFDIVSLFDMSINQGISVFVQGNNILDKEIWSYAWGGTTNESMPVNPGRSVYFGFRVALK